MTTSRDRPPSVTFNVQVVQPRECPGVRCATSVVPPSVTVSPSWMTRSIGCGLPPGCIRSSAGTSSAIATTWAPLSALTAASPSMWSPWAWLPSSTLMSENLKPSASTDFWITGTFRS